LGFYRHKKERYESISFFPFQIGKINLSFAAFLPILVFGIIKISGYCPIQRGEKDQ